ncbi:bile acid:sodium symporter family protein [uncultured Dialister sp.]|jgi:BASS family bile acid:Na+ symporter|uniref:bile acid:sodium symporter family protein n=1 Tax=uncultured Dialister sp. TaxID=278064 RepID=UPI0025CD16EF|nr:bile acid:sodium symporter family protein [uncultured Dialister sp.]
MKKLCAMIGKYFGIIAIVFLILGFTMPENFKWVLSKVGGISVLTFLLGVVMFGMGTTLSVKDFVLVFKRPRDVFLGAVAQFFIMPFLAFSLATIFQLDPALTAGVILVGTCPGGTSSNVITFMSKGDVALSVTMTSVSTVLSPILTPAITYLLIGTKIAFDPVGMFLSIVQIVIVPICLGVAVKTFLPKLAAAATDYTPAISSIAISLIIAGVIGASKNAIFANFGIILLVVILHNCLGYALGFAVARLTGLSWKKAVALSIEVGMQNSGLAVGLAKAHFAAMPAATVPGAIFSAWHNISGAMLAWLYVNVLNPRFDPELRKEMEALHAPAKELA